MFQQNARQLQNIDWRDFERCTAALFSRAGYGTVLTTPTCDDGIDVRITHPTTKKHAGIDAKCIKSDTISPSSVTYDPDYSARHLTDYAILATAQFSHATKKQAKKDNVTLIGFKSLLHALDTLGDRELVTLALNPSKPLYVTKNWKRVRDYVQDHLDIDITQDAADLIATRDDGGVCIPALEKYKNKTVSQTIDKTNIYGFLSDINTPRLEYPLRGPDTYPRTAPDTRDIASGKDISIPQN